MLDEFLANLADTLGIKARPVPRPDITYANSSSDHPQDRSAPYVRGPNEGVNTLAPNAGVQQIPLPSYLVDRPGPEKYEYVLGHKNDAQGAPEDHSADVRQIPWNKNYVAALGAQGAADLANTLVQSQKNAIAAGPPSDAKDPDAVLKMLASVDPSHIADASGYGGKAVYKTGHLGRFQPLEEQDALDYIDFMRNKGPAIAALRGK